MSIDPTVTRRALLAAGTAGAATIVLAGCSSGGAGADTKSQAPATDPVTGADSSPGADSDSSSSSDASGDSGASGKTIASLDDIPIGGAISVQLPDGKPGIVARPSAATAAAFSAICTHQGCTVKPKGKQLDCPCHGSVFDATTGKVMGGPAPSPLPSVNVTVSGGKVIAS